jgi:hypothetical protein
MKPDSRRRQRHEHNTEHLERLECVLMVLLEIVAFVVLLSGMVRLQLVLEEVGRVFVSDGHDLS